MKRHFLVVAALAFLVESCNAYVHSGYAKIYRGQDGMQKLPIPAIVLPVRLCTADRPENVRENPAARKLAPLVWPAELWKGLRLPADAKAETAVVHDPL